MHIVVLPGLDGTGKMLVGFVKTLAVKYSVEVINYPVNKILSYSELAELVSGKLPKDKPYVIIAESFSGPIAVKISAQAPKHLKGVLFVASFIKNPTVLSKQLGALPKRLPLKSSTLLRLAKPFTFGKWASKDLEKLLISAVKHVSHEVIANRLKEVMAVDERVKFRSIKLPMLYIRPMTDRLVSKTASLEMHLLNKNIHIEEIEGPHFILQTHKNICVEKISHFLQSIN